jgi:hypothetical protein
VAGLVNGYLPDRGHFDAWAADPDHGGGLNLAELDLVQKRNHILKTSLDALPDKARQLLATLALLSEAVDYDTLAALNPHLPPQPEPPPEPERPQDRWDWEFLSAAKRRTARKQYAADRKRYAGYEQDLQSWRDSLEFRAAARNLARTVQDLERRGLLQYDPTRESL